MKILLDKSNMTEQDWQDYRANQKGIGGSDVATILGLNPYKSRFTLWLEKTNQVASPDLSANPYVEWGNALEPVIREKFAQITGFEVYENHNVMCHDEHDFMVANIDGEVIDPSHNGERGVLEIKTANERLKEAWDEGVPHHYMLQVQHYLAVMNYDYGYICVLIGGNDFRYFKILRDDYVIDNLISAEMEFMKMVEEKNPPEISGHEADSNWLAETYPNANEDENFLDSELEELAFKYKEVQAEIKTLTEEANYIKNRIKAEAKDFKYLKSDRVKVTIPTITKTSFNSKQFEEDHPDLYKQYKNKVSSYRSFTVTPIK